MSKWIRNLFILLCMLFVMVPFGAKAAAPATAGWYNGKYYIDDEGDIVLANGVWMDGDTYYYFKKGVVQDVTGLQKVKESGETERYYLKSGRVVTNRFKTLKDGTKKYRFYFGKDGKAYRAEGNSYMSTTQVKLFKINGKKYGFDENAHMAKGLWSTKENKLCYFEDSGVLNLTKSKVYRKAAKVGRKSKTLPKQLKKVFKKPKKTQKSDSCNPFDVKNAENLSSKQMKKYVGYVWTYDHISMSMTKNKSTGVYYMEGAGPITD